MYLQYQCIHRPTYTVTSRPLLFQPALNAEAEPSAFAPGMRGALEIWSPPFSIQESQLLFSVYFLDHIWPLISSIFTISSSQLYGCHIFFSSSNEIDIPFSWFWALYRSALCLCSCSSCPALSPCSTHSSHLCSSSYLHYHSSHNLPPTFACSSQTSLLFFRSLPWAHSLCWSLLLPKIELSFPPPHMHFTAFTSKYQLLCDSFAVLHLFSFTWVLLSPLHLLQLANKNFLVGIKQNNFRCQTLN